MTSTISTFQSQFAGGVRPNLFECIVYPTTASSESGAGLPGFQFHCKGTSMPGSTIGNIDVPFQGRQLKVPGDRTFADWTVTVFNDNGMAIRELFEDWMRTIQDHNVNQGTLSPYGAADIKQRGRDGRVMRTYKITSMYPTEVAAIDLAWDSNDAVEEYAVTFAVNNYTYNSGEATTTSGSEPSGKLTGALDSKGNWKLGASGGGRIS
jgi:hypothetical protein